jgi:hypothetical protein
MRWGRLIFARSIIRRQGESSAWRSASARVDLLGRSQSRRAPVGEAAAQYSVMADACTDGLHALVVCGDRAWTELRQRIEQGHRSQLAVWLTIVQVEPEECGLLRHPLAARRERRQHAITRGARGRAAPPRRRADDAAAALYVSGTGLSISERSGPSAIPSTGPRLAC